MLGLGGKRSVTPGGCLDSPSMTPDPMATPYGTHFELSTHLIARALISRGHDDLYWLRPGMFVARVNGHVIGWNMTRCSITSSIGAEIAGRKDYTRQMLKNAGVPVAAGGSYRPSERDRALAKAKQLGWPVIIKPADGSKGRGVALVHDAHELAAAWDEITTTAKIVVERRMIGEEARFLVVDGRCVAVAGRIPAHVIGDGRSTVRELVAAKNAAREKNPHLATRPLPVGVEPELVPDVGQRVVLDHRGGYSTGADSVDMTDMVHPGYRLVAEQAYAALPGLGLCGVDIIAADWAQPPAAGNHIVVEVNSRPAIGAHHFPWDGKPRDAAGAIVDACLRRVGALQPQGWLARLGRR